MERLTGRDNGNPYQISCFEGDGCPDMETKKCYTCPHYIAVYEKLAAYEDAEEQNRLIILPYPSRSGVLC